MTPVQTLELRLGESRRKLADAIGTAEPDMMKGGSKDGRYVQAGGP